MRKGEKKGGRGISARFEGEAKKFLLHGRLF
jgi:hypothetical protein